MAADSESPVDSPDEMSDFSDAGSDFVFEPKTYGRKRAISAAGSKPPKRPRRKAAGGIGSNLSRSPILTRSAQTPQPQQPSHGTSRQGSPRPVRGTHQRNQGIIAENMYDAVHSGKSAMTEVVDEWLEVYKQDREAGLLVLVNFIVQCCGCKGVVSSEMFAKNQHAEIISTLTKDFKEDSSNYPLCAPGKRGKRFRAGLCEFVQVLVRCCRNSVLYDENLFSSMLAFLTGLSDSQVRAFRHTSTLLAMKLMTEMVKVAVIVHTQLKTIQRHYDLETNKRAEDRAARKLEELQATVDELREYQEELSALMNGMFRGVFVHRHRDFVPEIRSVCIEELGVWLRENPVDFLTDGYLKYLGWTLHDKQSAVRLRCLQALQGLYQEKDFIGRLELFTSRFKDRILSMVLDKDPDVAVEATQLLLLIQEMTEEGFTEEECGHVYPLVFALHRGLASAAGAFLYYKLKIAMDIDRQDAGGDQRQGIAFFYVLISFYIQSEFHEHGAYLVDSLWAVAGSHLKDWDTMTSLLLHEAGQDQGLSDDEEGALIELMMCATRQAAEGAPPVGRAQGKSVLSMKAKKTLTQDRRRITNHFVSLLPQLLTKYSADADKVKTLLRMPLYFDLEIYSSAGRMEKYLDLLLSKVCAIVEKHTDEGVLEACARVASALCANGYTFSGRVHLAFSQLLDGLSERFTTYLSDVLQGTADEDEVYTATSALKRIAAFSSAKNLTNLMLFDPCIQLLKTGVESGDLDKELIVPALKCVGFHLIWSKVMVDSSTPTEVEVKRLKKEVCSFCSVCRKCLPLGQAEIRDKAFELLCDVLLVYSTVAFRSQPALHKLAHLPSSSLCTEMAAFLLDNIFTDPEDEELIGEEQEEVRLDILQRKRTQLAGFCKLIIHGVLNLCAATDVFKHYDKFYKDYGDIIKETISKTKLISPVQSAKVVCLSLQQLFTELNPEDDKGHEFGELRMLAKRLAMSFGVNLHGFRKPLMSLHTDGIHFALQDLDVPGLDPPNLLFLEILSEFSFKLLPQDRTQLVKFLMEECTTAALSRQSVRMYKRSLQVGSVPKSRETADQEERTSTPPTTHNTPVTKRRRTTSLDSEDSTNGGLSGSSIGSKLPTPTITSTVARRADAQPRTSDLDNNDNIYEPVSEEEFTDNSQMHKAKPKTLRCPSTDWPGVTSEKSGLDNHLDMLSLIESEESEMAEEDEEPFIEDIETDENDPATANSQPSAHHSVSFLEDLFD